MEQFALKRRFNPGTHEFAFATGIENSYPMIVGRDGRTERLTSDRAFVTALKNLVKANILAEEGILEVQPRAYFIQSESSEHFHASCPVPEVQDLADHLNHERFMSLDLCYGHHDICWCVYERLMDNGMTREEFRWFLQHGRALKSHHIMGNDYYVTNEHLVHPDGRITSAGAPFGYYRVTK